ncbi:hypothetical protein E8D34_17200 [Nocardioides sp. GY 10113]|uniref:DUF6457 domain-containing protein n=1 Tax=Nocardioides sp. GY 10113 TaxID=2569761 RepID=UPI0010A7D51F|nr:DUF6457 domain-containing protein [Nocardioides sp. GY 10113]TIC82217.1 hypothetical protein E8D34_17200 [Nocardioides sp. GY 10113]
MNLHDWIDEVCDLLDIESEADEGLLNDLADRAVANVHAAAGPVTAFLVGVAAGATDADPDRVERMVERVQGLADAWDRPAGVVEEEIEDVEVEELPAADAPADEYDDEDSLV